MKPPRTSTSNTKNIRREIIQIIFLDLKGHWNQAQKPLETSTKPQIGEALRIQAFKAPKNFHHKPSNTTKQSHPNYFPRSQSSLKSSSKASRNLNKLQISEALRIQAFKASKNFHHKPSKRKNARRTQRTRRTHKEREEQRIYNKLIVRDSL